MWIYSRSRSPNARRYRALQGWRDCCNQQRARSGFSVGILLICRCRETGVNGSRGNTASSSVVLPVPDMPVSSTLTTVCLSLATEVRSERAGQVAPVDPAGGGQPQAPSWGGVVKCSANSSRMTQRHLLGRLTSIRPATWNIRAVPTCKSTWMASALIPG